MSQIPELVESLDYGPAPETRAPADEWLEARGRSFGHFIGGEWTSPIADGAHEGRNPFDGELLARISQGGVEEVDHAVRVATDAAPGWWALGGHARARYLYGLARGVQKHSRLFALLETLDNGKPIRESRDLDIPLVARHFYHHAGWAELLEREFPDMLPHGVVGQVIPWNFPLLMLAWKVAPALAAGNTVVLKPAEWTSLTGLLFAELTREVGLPPGVFNLVTGDGETGEAIVRHPGVAKIAFTGSTEVGRRIREVTAGTGKTLSLELGGKSPFVVFDDADLDSVVEGVVDAIWFNQGQVCCAGSRILVQESVAGELERKLKARMARLRLGDPLEKAVDMGPIVSPVQHERIRALVEQGREEGAHIWQPDGSDALDPAFYPPTLCTGVEAAGVLAQVEVFGPVVVMMTFRTPVEAVELANDTRYGLAASIWSESLNVALEVAPKVKAGTVWVNCTNLFDAASGFGGYRESGFGREGGREGMLEYLRPGWEDGPRGEADAVETPLRSRLQPPLGGDGAEVQPSTKDARAAPSIDRTPKHYIGGRGRRPDSGHSLELLGEGDELLGVVPRGNRKDVRDAVEAARRALPGWSGSSAHLRAQILFFVAENLELRAEELIHRLTFGTGIEEEAARREVHMSAERLFAYAGWADKFDGRVHGTPFRNVTLAMVEPLGVMAISAPARHPLLGLVATVAPAVAMGNTVIALPSERLPLVAADLAQILDTSDVPAGVVNLVTGFHRELLPTLAAHDTVDGIWHFGDEEEAREVELLSTGNLKRTWVGSGMERDWTDPVQGAGEEFLRHATQIKNVWVPYGE